MLFSIIIVNYNSCDLLYNCVKSITGNLQEVDYEIVVVDNNSSDNSLELCRQIHEDRLKIIESKNNLGFAKANNLGVQHASGDVLHFLNPDTEVSRNLVADYERISNDILNTKEYVYVNPMKDLDGHVYYGKYFIPDSVNYLRYLFCMSKTKWYYIGATVIMSKNTFEKIGGWNEAFFMYAEDTDLFYRINEHKIKIIELPVAIFHLGAGTSKNAYTNLQREVLIQKSLRTYFKCNHLGLLNYCCFQVMVILSFFRRPKRAWWQLKAIKESFQ